MAERLKEARKAIGRELLAGWACGVLDTGVWSYDRKGWHGVARLGAARTRSSTCCDTPRC